MALWNTRESKRSWPLSLEDGLTEARRDEVEVDEDCDDVGKSFSSPIETMRSRVGVEGSEGGGVGGRIAWSGMIL